MAALTAADLEIHSDPQDLKLIAAAGMLLFHDQYIRNPYIHGLHSKQKFYLIIVYQKE